MAQWLPTIAFYTQSRIMSRDLAEQTIKSLIAHQQWFVFDPQPDGRCQIDVKDEKFARDVLFQWKDQGEPQNV